MIDSAEFFDEECVPPAESVLGVIECASCHYIRGSTVVNFDETSLLFLVEYTLSDVRKTSNLLHLAI